MYVMQCRQMRCFTVTCHSSGQLAWSTGDLPITEDDLYAQASADFVCLSSALPHYHNEISIWYPRAHVEGLDMNEHFWNQHTEKDVPRGVCYVEEGQGYRLFGALENYYNEAPLIEFMMTNGFNHPGKTFYIPAVPILAANNDITLAELQGLLAEITEPGEEVYRYCKWPGGDNATIGWHFWTLEELRRKTIGHHGQDLMDSYLRPLL
jgi:hypothetical protein